MHRLDMSNNKLIYLQLLLGISAVIAIIIGISQLWNAKQSNSWPSIRGKIIESYVTSNDRSPHSNVHVDYEYSVENVVYRGDRLSYSLTFNRYADVSFYAGKFNKGASVDVYYEPSSPSNSVLIPGYEQELDEFGTIISGSFMLTIVVMYGWISRNGEPLTRDGWPVKMRKIGKW